MKVLYAVQGTGNGHISRSKEVIKQLGKNCEVDVLLSESQHEVDLGFEVKYKLKGLGWNVLVLWECEINKKKFAEKKINKFLKSV